MKKVLIISTSLRVNSNSEILAHETERGAIEAGYDTEFITLKNKNIKFCNGCLSCQKFGKCIIEDDANEITEKMKNADTIVWATPVYYYTMSGQMKTLIDRANALYKSDYKFKEIYIIATAGDSRKGAINIIIEEMKGWLACFDNVKLNGFIDACGLEKANDAKQNSLLLKEAYNMGKNIK